MSILSDGCTSVGARQPPHRKLPVAPSRATAYKPRKVSPQQPTGASSSASIGTLSTTTAKSSTSTSSTLSSAVQLPPTSTNKIMSKLKITINLEHMRPDEQMRYFIRLADIITTKVVKGCDISLAKILG